MFVVRSTQLRAFEEAAQDDFEGEMALRCHALAPHLCRGLGDAALRRAIHQAVSDAAAHGFTHRGPAQLYVELTLVFGRGFDTDPQYPWAAEQLARDALLDQLIRSDALYTSASAHVQQVAPLDPRRAHAAVLRLSTIEGDAPVNELRPDLRQRLVADARAAMAEAHPEKCAHIGGDSLDRLAALAVTQAWDEHGFRAPRSILLVALLMFTFGHRCADDPFHPWIGGLLAPSADPDRERASRRLESEAARRLLAAAGERDGGDA